MALSRLVTALSAQIAAQVPGAPSVGSAAPASAGELPLVTVAIEAATSSMRSIGQVPGPVQTGALRVDVELDLADLVLHVGGDPSMDVPLISDGRRLLQLPHGSIVRADGTDTPPFDGGDLLVRAGATTFTPVQTAPGAGEVQLDVAAGTLRFPSALATSGTLSLGYFIGAWEVRVDRFSATAHLDVAAASADALATLVPQVERALAQERIPVASGIRRIEPTALSAGTPAFAATDAPRRQRLTYTIEFEAIDPIIPTSGGPIVTVDVDVEPFGEHFTISREAQQP